MNNNHGRRRTRRVRQQRKQQKTQIGRILLTVGLMALIAVVSIGGTIAWLTDDTEQITNTFTHSDINITISEDEGGLNKEFKMVPGATIAKDPKVTVEANSESLWLFVEVTESQTPDFDAYLSYNFAEGWSVLSHSDDDDTHVIYRTEKVLSNAEAQTFNILAGGVDGQVTVNGTVTKTMMENIKDNNAKPTITFKAYAVQSENLTVTQMADIWALAKPTNP